MARLKLEARCGVSSTFKAFNKDILITLEKKKNKDILITRCFLLPSTKGAQSNYIYTSYNLLVREIDFTQNLVMQYILTEKRGTIYCGMMERL